MKTHLVLLLIGFMLLGLALSALAAGPVLTVVKTGESDPNKNREGGGTW